MPTDAWAQAAAALPQDARWQREAPFWRSVGERWGWRRVADAGCGAGFHVSLLAALGVDTVGFDLSLAALHLAPVGRRVAGDLVLPPLRKGTFDGVLCLGNTMSLLPTRSAQRRALDALAALLRPGGVLLLQGEDAGALVAAAPLVRTRSLAEGGVHVRVFERRGRRVRMLAGVVPPAGEAGLGETWLLPTTAAVVAQVGRRAGLQPAALPANPPTGAGWWLALQRRQYT